MTPPNVNRSWKEGPVYYSVHINPQPTGTHIIHNWATVHYLNTPPHNVISTSREYSNAARLIAAEDLQRMRRFALNYQIEQKRHPSKL